MDGYKFCLLYNLANTWIETNGISTACEKWIHKESRKNIVSVPPIYLIYLRHTIPNHRNAYILRCFFRSFCFSSSQCLNGMPFYFKFSFRQWSIFNEMKAWMSIRKNEFHPTEWAIGINPVSVLLYFSFLVWVHVCMIHSLILSIPFHSFILQFILLHYHSLASSHILQCRLSSFQLLQRFN